ncbi:uncharacterized protein LOC133226027 [Neopsephotus bourkii]|uniref:uncharacterized protein LOC133226027 n=1 Tax=Neopsephotus bourkii TaxID=309878 RepID=UPI002AA508BA|nr:uncharacterized protein LOC133226027 [Neopsephotus bourkii]
MLQVTSSITTSLQKHASRGWSLVTRRRKPSPRMKGISALTQTLVRKTEHIVCDGSLHQNGSGAKLRLRKKFSLPSDERSVCFLPLLPLVSVHAVLCLLQPHHLQGPIPLSVPKGLVTQPLILKLNIFRAGRLKIPSLNCERILPCWGVVHRQSGFYCVHQTTLEIRCRKQVRQQQQKSESWDPAPSSLCSDSVTVGFVSLEVVAWMGRVLEAAVTSCLGQTSRATP